MHIADFSVGMLGANGIVGAGIPIAVGAAQGKRLLGENVVVCCFFGDGALNRGQFFEALNWARIFNLPVLFVCEDNEYASTTRTVLLTGGPGPAVRAESFGIPAFTFDGNDVVAIDALAGTTVEQIRAGGGPVFFHARTYRFRGHTVFDKQLYRTRAEVEEHEVDDPVPRCRAFLTRHGVAEETLDRIDQAARAEIATAVEFARGAPVPDPALARRDVQDLGGPE
jgi:pyruvate dehydrogenase E1 component alpha subunit